MTDELGAEARGMVRQRREVVGQGVEARGTVGQGAEAREESSQALLMPSRGMITNIIFPLPYHMICQTYDMSVQASSSRDWSKYLISDISKYLCLHFSAEP